MTIAVPLDCLDRLHQVRDELSTIWLAMGNTADMADDLLLDVREALNGTRQRLVDTCRAIEEAPRTCAAETRPVSPNRTAN